ncbi:MAG: EAL domain-containing protein [Thermoleophilaceae bacterium]
MSTTPLARILDEGLIRPVFQPLVDLYSGETLGYEALARGPEGPLQRPDLLFAAGRQEGRLAELDRACRRAAGAREAPTPPSCAIRPRCS